MAVAGATTTKEKTSARDKTQQQERIWNENEATSESSAARSSCCLRFPLRLAGRSGLRSRIAFLGAISAALQREVFAPRAKLDFVPKRTDPRTRAFNPAVDAANHR